MWDDPLEDFLTRSAKDGFDAVEIYLPAESESAADIGKAAKKHGLKLVAQTISEGDSAEDHMKSLDERIAKASDSGALFLNAHIGKDILSFEDNARIIDHSLELSRRYGIALTHELHRGRPTFCGPSTTAHLKRAPEMRINADFSHWFCVHESDLKNQPENVELASLRCDHIHARVGHAEGSQVADPLAECWRYETERSIELWQNILDLRAREGREFFTITPEFGPAPYMPIDHKTGQMMEDPWSINVRFKDHLKKTLRSPS